MPGLLNWLLIKPSVTISSRPQIVFGMIWLLKTNGRRCGNSSRLLHGLDLSMVLHQGGVVALDHSFQGMKTCQDCVQRFIQFRYLLLEVSTVFWGIMFTHNGGCSLEVG